MNASPHDERADLGLERTYPMEDQVRQAIQDLGDSWVARIAGCDGPLSAEQEQRVLDGWLDRLAVPPGEDPE